MSSAGYRMMVALLAAAATGCAGNGNGLDANGNPVTPGGGGGTPLTADFKSIQDNVFTPICTKCHIGAGAPQGLQVPHQLRKIAQGEGHRQAATDASLKDKEYEDALQHSLKAAALLSHVLNAPSCAPFPLGP